MLLDDPVDSSESQAGAALMLGREEGLKDALLHFGAHTYPKSVTVMPAD